MAGIFDSIKVYNSEWEEVGNREFTPEEQEAIKKATVVTSGWGFSACFFLAAGKSYIPIEPSANVSSGDELDVSNLKLVALEYRGTDPNITKTKVMRIRIVPKAVQATDFNNPFGL